MISKGFLKSSFIYSFIGALPLASSFILLPFYTQYLSKGDFGLLALYIIFTQLFQILLNFGLDNYIPISFVNNLDNSQKQKKSISTAVFLLVFGGLMMSLMLYLVGPYLFKLFDPLFKNEHEAFVFFPWGFFCVLTAFFNSLFKSYTNLLVNQQRPMRFFWCNITNFLLTISISVIGIMLFPKTLIGPMYGRLLSGLGIFIMALVFFGKEYGFTFHKEYLKDMFRFAYPMAFYFFVLWLLANINNYILLYFSDAGTVAILSFAIMCTQLIDFFQNGLSSAIYPRIYAIWNTSKVKKSIVEVNRYYNGLSLASTIVLPLFMLLLPPLVMLFVKKPEYYESFYLLPLLTIGFSGRGLYAMFYMPLLYFKKTTAISKVYFIASVLQIGISIILIKYYGILGAAITISLIKIVQIVLLYFESRKIFEFRFSFAKQILLPLVYMLLVIAGEPSASYLNHYLIFSIQFVVVAFLSWFLFKNEIRQTMLQYLPNKR